MEIKVKSYSSQSSLISSIIYFILGAILFTKAEEVIKFISIAFGVILGVVAVVNFIIFYITFKNVEKETKKMSLILGIISLIIAIIFIFFSGLVEQIIGILVGGWILFSGIIRFINVLSINPKNKKFLPLLIVSLLLIGTGIYTIIYGHTVLSIVGIIMIIYSVLEIIGYIFYTKDNNDPIEPGTTTLIVPDEPVEIKEEEKNIKDVKMPKEKKDSKKKKDKEENK